MGAQKITSFQVKQEKPSLWSRLTGSGKENTKVYGFHTDPKTGQKIPITSKPKVVDNCKGAPIGAKKIGTINGTHLQKTLNYSGPKPTPKVNPPAQQEPKKILTHKPKANRFGGIFGHTTPYVEEQKCY